MKQRKIVYLCPGRSRDERSLGLNDGTTPRDFYYGIDALHRRGHSALIVDTRKDPEGSLNLARLKWEIMRNSFTGFGTSLERVLATADQISQSDVAISFTDGFSVSLGMYGRKLSPNTKLVGGFHGVSTMVERSRTWAQAYAHRRVVQAFRGLDHVFFFGEADRDYAINTYGLDPDRASIFRFGVDLDFWSPSKDTEENEGDTPVVFAVGSDLSRDYDTLLSAEFNAHLRIATRIKLHNKHARSFELISGSYHSAAVTDLKLRDLYREAALIATPVKDVLQPSGYSVTLQAMACGKPVVLSDFRGLWDREVFKSGENCLLVGQGNPVEMGKAIQLLLDDSGLRHEMGKNARATAEQVFSLSRMENSASELVGRV